MFLITDDAKLLLTDIYKHYLELEDTGSESATWFTPEYAENCDVFPGRASTLERCFSELHQLGFIDLCLDYSFVLTNKGIAYMDSQYHHNVDSVIEFLKSLVIGRFSK